MSNSKEAITSWLARNVVQYMRKDNISRFIRAHDGKKAGYQTIERPVEGVDLENHLFNEQPIGLFVVDPAFDGYTRCAVVDLDDKKHELEWEELCVEAKKIDDILASHLLLSWPCRSGSGHGIHLWLFWKDLQPAAVVRDILKTVVLEAGVRCKVDIFPAQSTLDGAKGNLVALPLGRASRPIDLTTSNVQEMLGDISLADVALSAPVIKPNVWSNKGTSLSPLAGWAIGMDQGLRADSNVGGLDDYGAPDPELIKEALSHVTNTEHGVWLRVGLALKQTASQGLLDETVAFEIWDNWSESATNYDPKAMDYSWTRFRPRDGGVSLGTIWWLAKDGGWKPKAEDLDPGSQVVSPRPALVLGDIGGRQIRANVADNLSRPELVVSNDRGAVVNIPNVVESGALAAIIGEQRAKEVASKLLDAQDKENLSVEFMASRLGSAGTDPLPPDPLDVTALLWQTDGAEDEIKAVNLRHFMAIDGGRAAVFREEWDAVMHRQYLSRINISDFKAFYQNRQVLLRTTRQGKPVYKPLGDMWLESPYRRQYKCITLRPEGCPANEYNLWRGWTLEPSEQGSWDLLQTHMLQNLCMGDKEAYEYMFNWWATLFQKPETPIGVALVLRGARGTGKSSMVRAFGELLGQHFLHVMNSRSITGQFNNHLRDCALLFADEAVWAGSKSEESTLKGIITEPTLTIEGKGRDSVNCRNMIHLVIATNSDWAVPTGMDERRFCILEVGEGKKQNSEYFQAIQRQLKNGGQARLLWDMLHRDIRKFNPGRVPNTREMTRQKLLSLEPWAAWWYQCLQEGRTHAHHEGWKNASICRTDLMFESYVMFCRSLAIKSQNVPPQTLLGHVRKITQSKLPYMQRKLTVEMRVPSDEDGGLFRKVGVVVLPSLEHCRESFCLLIGGDIVWSGETDEGSSSTIDGSEYDYKERVLI